jgi:uncharacterized membrane protein HdeD (DUF308 family)
MTKEVQIVTRVKNPWWRFILGALLLYAGVKSLFLPDPNIPIELRYSNLTQKVSGEFVQAVLGIVGIWLIFAGINILRKRQTKS